MTAKFANPNEVRSEIIYRRTYSREVPIDSGKFETKQDTINRVIGHQRWLWERALGQPLNSSQEAELAALGGLMMDNKVMVSGRTLWMGGTEISKKYEATQFNCAATRIETVYDVVDALWLLLLGSGVGFKPMVGSLTGFAKPIKNIVIVRSKKQPGEKGNPDNVEIWNKETKTWTIKIGDSSESWAKSVGKLLAGKFPAETLILDFSEVRCAGTRLTNFGWISSGDENISRAYENIAKILNRRAGSLLTKIDIMDVMNWLGTSLSSRRSAQICFIDYGSNEWEDFALAKKDYWLTGNPQRAQSNNSLLFYSTPSKDELKKVFSLMAEAGGCLPLWSTLLVKDKGMTQLKDIDVGDQIWSKEGWTTVKNKWSTGVKPVFAYKTKAGTLFATNNHRVVVDQNNTKVQVGVAENLCWLAGPESQLKPDLNAVLHGLLIGDGTNYKGHGKKCILYIGKDDQDYFESEIGEYIGEMIEKRDSGYEIYTDLNPELLIKKRNIEITEEMVNSSPSYVASFLRGLFSANGSVITSKYSEYVKLSLTSPKLRDQVMLMLSSLGIKSRYINKAGREGKINVRGTDRDCKFLPSYEIRITKDKSKFATMVGFLQKHKTEKLQKLLEDISTREVKYSTPEKSEFDIIEQSYVSTEEVFDIEVDNESHTFWCNGFDISNSEPGLINANEAERRAPWFVGTNPCSEILLPSKGFCNLVEINLAAFRGDTYGLHEAARLIARANYRQTCVDLRDGILQEAWHLNNAFLRLCGVGLTGVAQRPELIDYDYAQLERTVTMAAYSMADELDLPRSKNVTCVKPSGTLSKVMGCTEGIHKPLSKYIFNNVVFAKADPLVEKLRKANYKIMDHPLQSGEVIITLPVSWEDVEFTKVIKNNKTLEVNLDSAIEQLENYKRIQNSWTHQNTSVTISYSPEEVPEIIEWLHNNWDYYVGVSFIYRTDPTMTAKDLGYAYLPQQAVSKEEYEEYVSELDEVDFSGTEADILLESADCHNGVCPIR